jgi:hypothetical protein
VFENRFLRRIFGSKWAEVMEGGRVVSVVGSG